MSNDDFRIVSGMVDCIRATVNIAERELNDFVGRLEPLRCRGYSPETLAMIRLERDAATLRALADRIDNVRTRLTEPERN